MKRFTCLVILSYLSAFDTSAQGDALMEAALAGDRARWTEQLESVKADASAHPIWQTCAAPFPSRPTWAQINDDALWLLVHWTAPNHAYFNGQSASQSLDALHALPEPVESEIPWMPIIAALGLVALAAAGIYAFKVQRLASMPLPEALKALDARLNGDMTQHGTAVSVWHVWLSALFPAERELDLSALSGFKLSASELEVVIALVDGLNAEETAIRLACTPAHVYNVRSRIRGKLNLDADTQLDRYLQRMLNLRE